MRIELVLSGEEVTENIPYTIICTTRYSNVWNTMKRKQRWNKEFTPIEQGIAEEIFRQAQQWFTKGVPNSIRMEFLIFELWNKIAEFCGSLS